MNSYSAKDRIKSQNQLDEIRQGTQNLQVAPAALDVEIVAREALGDLEIKLLVIGKNKARSPNSDQF